MLITSVSNKDNVLISGVSFLLGLYHAVSERHYSNSGTLLSYCGGGVMGSMVTGFCVGVRI